MGTYTLLVGVLIVTMHPERTDMLREDNDAGVVEVDVKEAAEDSKASATSDAKQATDEVRADVLHDEDDAAKKVNGDHPKHPQKTSNYNVYNAYGTGNNPFSAPTKPKKKKQPIYLQPQPVPQAARRGNEYLGAAGNTVAHRIPYGAMGYQQQNLSQMPPRCDESGAQKQVDMARDSCCRGGQVQGATRDGTYTVTVSHAGLGLCQNGECHSNLPYVEVTFQCPQVCNANPRFLDDWEIIFANDPHAAMRMDANSCSARGACNGVCYSPGQQLRGNVAPNAPLLRDCVAISGRHGSIQGAVMSSNCGSQFRA